MFNANLKTILWIFIEPTYELSVISKLRYPELLVI